MCLCVIVIVCGEDGSIELHDTDFSAIQAVTTSVDVGQVLVTIIDADVFQF